MRLRRRRYLLLLGSSVDPADRYGTSALVRTRRSGRVRRFVHIGVLLTVISLTRVARVARPGPRLLTGLALAALTVFFRDSLWGMLFLAVLVLYLPPWSPRAD